MSSVYASHDPKLISILEIVGSYFVDVYFNHVFNAVKSKLRARGSLTDEYMRHVQSYMIGVKTDNESYHKVIQNLHKYFQSTTRFTTLSFADFVEKIVEHFIPPQYHDILKAAEKDETLGAVIVDLASGLGVYVTSNDVIRRIIDEHDVKPDVTIRMIQDHAVTMLLSKRNEIHNQFLRRVGQAKNMVSMDLVEDLKGALRKLAKDKARLQRVVGDCEERIAELEDEVAAHKKREIKFQKLITLLRKELVSGAPAAAAYVAAGEQTLSPNRHAEYDNAWSDKVKAIEPQPDYTAEEGPHPQTAKRARPQPPTPSFFAEPIPFAAPAVPRSRKLVGNITELMRRDEEPEESSDGEVSEEASE